MFCAIVTTAYIRLLRILSLVVSVSEVSTFTLYFQGRIGQ